MNVEHSIQFCSSEDLINMKGILAVIFAIGAVSAARSGPYLPSGWKPSGPAFYLPTEVQKPADNPVKDLLFASEASGSEDLREYGPPKLTVTVETEASGSEGLQEYGPPKEALTVQTLPNVVTEQTFYVIDGSALVEQQREADVKVEQSADYTQEATTEAQVVEVTQDFADTDVTATYETVTDKIEAVAKEVEIVTEDVEVATENVEIATDKAQIVEAEVKEVESTVAAVEEKVENVAVEEQKLENIVVQEKEEVAEVVEAVEGIKNIAEALVVIESENKQEEAKQSIETVGELKVNQEESDVSGPEGFLEYGPPSFREYGPPKGDELRLDAENEVRRRRYSPKFRSSVNKKH